MLRGLIFFVKLAVVVAAAVWLAERPGEVAITWQGYQIETTVGLLLLGILAVAVAAVLLSRVWRGIRQAPGEVGRVFRGRRTARGYQALTQGMVSVAAGEPEEARRHAKRASGLLDNPALTHLLSAQAAQLNGEDDTAREHFRAMLEDPETRFLGLRGLYRQAQREGNSGEALDHVRQARDIRPETPWVLTALFDLGVKTGDIDTALEAVADMQKYHRLSKDEAKRRRGVLLAEKARRAQAEGRTQDARDASRRAVDLAPDLSPAAQIRAEVQLADDERRRAARTLENAWARAPHPDLVAPYLRARKADTPVDGYRRLQKMTERNPGHRESERALGRAALDAELWGEARKHLTKAAGETPSEGICGLLAELEEREHGDRDAAAGWLRRATEAPADPAWICESCGAVASQWHAQCSHCDAVDSFSWRAPIRVVEDGGEPATQARLEPSDAATHGGDASGPNVADAEVEAGEAETAAKDTESAGDAAGHGEARVGKAAGA